VLPVIDRPDFDKFLRREFNARARRALAIYRRTPLRLDAPGYPFRRRPEDGSIRSPRSSSIKPIPGGVRITVQSRGAPFIEDGNDGGGRYIRARNGSALALPLKGKRKKGGRIVLGEDGRPYLMQQRVRTYRGRHLLERSVGYAFTGRSGLRGGRS
jgi:hypothetical protein